MSVAAVSQALKSCELAVPTLASSSTVPRFQVSQLLLNEPSWVEPLQKKVLLSKMPAAKKVVLRSSLKRPY